MSASGVIVGYDVGGPNGDRSAFVTIIPGADGRFYVDTFTPEQIHMAVPHGKMEPLVPVGLREDLTARIYNIDPPEPSFDPAYRDLNAALEQEVRRQAAMKADMLKLDMERSLMGSLYPREYVGTFTAGVEKMRQIDHERERVARVRRVAAELAEEYIAGPYGDAYRAGGLTPAEFRLNRPYYEDVEGRIEIGRIVSNYITLKEKTDMDSRHINAAANNVVRPADRIEEPGHPYLTTGSDDAGFLVSPATLPNPVYGGSNPGELIAQGRVFGVDEEESAYEYATQEAQRGRPQRVYRFEAAVSASVTIARPTAPEPAPTARRRRRSAKPAE